MEDRIRRLEIEVESLKQELSRVRDFLKIPEPTACLTSLAPDQQELLDALGKEGARTRRQPLEKMRRKMGWETRRFEEAVTGLFRQGAVVLHESDTAMMSLSKMKEGIIGDDGRMFNEITLA